jgi:ketosteroid isomerase-like protein
MATPEAVRWRIETLDRDRRTLDDQLALLVPGVYRRLSVRVLRLPAGSRLRKALLSRALQGGNAAGNRGDYDRQFLLYAPDVEIHIDARWWAVDVDPVYRGVGGGQRMLAVLMEAFPKLRWELREVIDPGGGRFACRLDFVGVGRGSEVETRQEQWHAFLTERGLVVRHHVVSTEEEALAALAEEPQTLPGRARSARGEVGDVAVTRVQHPGPPRRSRNLEERLMVRFPGAWRALAAWGLRQLNPRSRLRRAMLRRAVTSGWDAGIRGDYELMLVRYAPDVEIETDPDFEALDRETFRGHEGRIEMTQTFAETWERFEMLPDILLDLGDDRLLVLGSFRLGGRGSGMELEREVAQLMTLRGGRVAREQWRFAWDKGLQVAGLNPDAIALPPRQPAGQAANRI